MERELDSACCLGSCRMFDSGFGGTAVVCKGKVQTAPKLVLVN